MCWATGAVHDAPCDSRQRQVSAPCCCCAQHAVGPHRDPTVLSQVGPPMSNMEEVTPTVKSNQAQGCAQAASSHQECSTSACVSAHSCKLSTAPGPHEAHGYRRRKAPKELLGRLAMHGMHARQLVTPCPCLPPACCKLFGQQQAGQSRCQSRSSTATPQWCMSCINSRRLTTKQQPVDSAQLSGPSNHMLHRLFYHTADMQRSGYTTPATAQQSA